MISVEAKLERRYLITATRRLEVEQSSRRVRELRPPCIGSVCRSTVRLHRAGLRRRVVNTITTRRPRRRRNDRVLRNDDPFDHARQIQNRDLIASTPRHSDRRDRSPIRRPPRVSPLNLSSASRYGNNASAISGNTNEPSRSGNRLNSYDLTVGARVRLSETRTASELRIVPVAR